MNGRKLILTLSAIFILGSLFSQRYAVKDSQGRILRGPSGFILADTSAIGIGEGPPILLSAEIGLLDDSIIVALFNELLDETSVPPASAFYVTEETGGSPTIVGDDFSTSYNPLHNDPDWNQSSGSGTFASTSGYAYCITSNGDNYVYHSGTFDDDQYAWVILNDVTNYFGPAVRADADSAILFYANAAGWYVGRVMSGSWETIGSGSRSFSDDDTLYTAASNDSIRCIHNSTQIFYDEMGSYYVGNGSPAMGSYLAVDGAKEFEGGELGASGSISEIGTNAISINDDSLFVALDSTAEIGANYLIDFTNTSNPKLKDLAGYEVADFVDTIVANNIGISPPPDTAYQFDISGQLRDSIDATQILGFDPTTTAVMLRGSYTTFPTTTSEGTLIHLGDTSSVKAKHKFSAADDNSLAYLSMFVSNGTYNTEYNRDTTFVDSVGQQEMIPEGDWWVDSEDGSNSNDGTTPATSVRDLQKVFSLNIQPNDTVRIKRGSVVSGQITLADAGLFIDGEEWGLPADPKAIWIGGDTMSGTWNESHADIWGIPFDDATRAMSFVVDGISKPVATGPWRDITGGASTTQFQDNTIGESSGYWDGAWVQSQMSSEWAFQSREVTDQTTITITTGTVAYGYSASRQYRFMHHNDTNVMYGNKGLAHFNDSVFMYSLSNPSSRVVIASQDDHAIIMNSMNGTVVQGIDFLGFIEEVFDINTSDNVKILNCGGGGARMFFNAYQSDNLEVDGGNDTAEFRNMYEDAFIYDGSDGGLIENMIFSNVGYPYGFVGMTTDLSEHGGAQFDNQIDGVTLQYCTFDSVAGRAMNTDEQNDQQKNIRWYKNYVHIACQLTSDCGCIYAVYDKDNSPSTRNEIIGNIIVNDGTDNGIYLDNGTDYWLLDSNFAYNLKIPFYVHTYDNTNDIILRRNSGIRNLQTTNSENYVMLIGTYIGSGHVGDSIEVKQNELVSTYLGSPGLRSFALTINDDGGNQTFTNWDSDSNHLFVPHGNGGGPSYDDAVNDDDNTPTYRTVAEYTSVGNGGSNEVATMDFFTTTGKAWISEAPWNDSEDDFIVVYNPTGGSMSVSFTGNFKDKNGNAESSPFTVKPWSHRILYKDPP